MTVPKTIGSRLRQLRIGNQMPLRQVAELTGIDKAILSKMERGQRRISGEVVKKLARIYQNNEEELMVLLLSDKIVREIGEEDIALKAMKVAEEYVTYQTFKKIDKKDVLKRLIEEIKEFPQIEKAWIFGSFARNDNNPESDIDIAIQASEDFTYFDLVEVQYKLEKLVQRKVDVGFFDSFKSYIFDNIQGDLKLIYEKQTP